MKLQSMQNLTRYLEYSRSFYKSSETAYNSSRFTVSLSHDQLSRLGINEITTNELLNIPNVNKVIRTDTGFLVEMKFKNKLESGELMPKEIEETNKKDLVDSLFKEEKEEIPPNNLKDLGKNLIKFFQNNIGSFVNAIKSNNNFK